MCAASKVDLLRQRYGRQSRSFVCNGTIESIWFSSEVLNHNLFSNCKLSFFATFIYSKFLVALLVEKTFPPRSERIKSNLVFNRRLEIACDRALSFEADLLRRFTVVSIQVDSIQIEVVSKHVGSRFHSTQSSGPQQGEKQGGGSSPSRNFQI